MLKIVNDKLKKCKDCKCEYDYDFHGKCPQCGIDDVENIDQSANNTNKNKNTFFDDKTKPGGLFLILAALMMLFIYSGALETNSVDDMRTMKNLSMLSYLLLFISGMFFIKN